MPKISIIIPLAPREQSWQGLLIELKDLVFEAEIILASTEEPPQDALPLSEARWLQCQQGGRAQQMNRAATEATGEFLWFLHADSRFDDSTLAGLKSCLDLSGDELYYFDLVFMNDATSLMKLNQWGVWWRCHLLKCPFGDQGFLLKKESFEQLGGYREDLDYGEDHVFTWKARQEAFRVLPTGAKLLTSARKYQDRAWLKTSLKHQWLWQKQAWPEFFKLLRRK